MFTSIANLSQIKLKVASIENNRCFFQPVEYPYFLTSPQKKEENTNRAFSSFEINIFGYFIAIKSISRSMEDLSQRELFIKNYAPAFGSLKVRFIISRSIISNPCPSPLINFRLFKSWSTVFSSSTCSSRNH